MNDLSSHSVSSQAQTPYRSPGRVAETEERVNPSVFGWLGALAAVVGFVFLGFFVCFVLLWGFFSCPVGFVAVLVLWAAIGFMRFMARRAIRERAKRALHTS
jgi:predicted lipid-binding transport protein (Tim44 family)